jgi:hypothetical protein
MKTNRTNDLNCFVFGHNFYLSKNINDSNDQFTCKCCHSKILVNTDDDINRFVNTNMKLQSLLIHLQFLRNSYTKKKLAV